MVAVESIKCEVEYDRNCTSGKKTVEYVSGYRRGDCRQIVREKCYRRKTVVEYSHSHGSHYHKRSPLAARDPEICDESKQVVCQKVPVYQEELKDVEVCQDTPRHFCRNTTILLPQVTCHYIIDDHLIFDELPDNIN